jgi:hypothetical protein
VTVIAASAAPSPPRHHAGRRSTVVQGAEDLRGLHLAEVAHFDTGSVAAITSLAAACGPIPLLATLLRSSAQDLEAATSSRGGWLVGART